MAERRVEVPRLVSLAVHEFRTPVSVAAGYIRMVLRQRQDELPPQQRKLLEEAEKSTGRIAQLLSDLSDVGALLAGTSPFEPTRFDVFELLTEVAADVHEGADREVRLEVQSCTQAAIITGDRRRCASALRAILVGTLREYGEPATVRTHCTVSAADGQARALLLVGAEPASTQPSDPIDSEHWDTFDEWRGGMGFALVSARLIVEAHSGRLWSHRRGRMRPATALSFPLQEKTG